MTTAVRERPILFSAPMVRAILAGRKTQTRRAVKPQPEPGRSVWPCAYSGTGWAIGEDPAVHDPAGCQCRPIRCPYGGPGDRLWCRETWAKVITDDADWCIYRADGEPSPYEPVTWRPSIHMPRWASRLTLEITGVRVERLQEISEADATAEGCESPEFRVSVPLSGPVERIPLSYRAAFANLWATINGHESWDANPWVWVVEFRRAEGGAR